MQTVSPTTRPTPDATALLAAAGAVLARDGLDGLTVRAIAKQAGTTTMAIYSRLGGKDGVLDAINREGFDVLNEACRQALAAAPDRPASWISAVCRTLRGFARTHGDHYRVMFGSPPDGHSRSDLAEQRARDFWTLLRRQVAAMVGEETATADAYALFALCHGLIELERGPLAAVASSADTAFNTAVAGMLRSFHMRTAGADRGADRGADLLSQIAAEAERVEFADLSLRETPARNAPCPCGSGKRYKHCHGAAA